MTLAYERLDDKANAKLGIDLQDESCPPEIRRLGRTITKWRHQIAAWHQAKFTNGSTEAVNYLTKRVKQVAVGITNWSSYRTRATALRRPTRLDTPRPQPTLKSELSL